MSESNTASTFEPKRPALVATLISSMWVAILSIPMLSGKFVAAAYNDQYSTGYAFREWAATQWKALGHFPLWNPELFVGMPFVAGMHGDLFYPTAFLRLILPTHVAMNIGFVVHYVLAAVFMYAFLRALKVSWTSSVVGGIAYQLSGVIGTYVSPGHDGKLFVTALLPLAALALTWAIRDRRWEGYGVFALTVGLSLLSPHPQMAQYFLIATGLYALYQVTTMPDGTTMVRRSIPLGVALGAVLVGLGIAALQYYPFYAYIPFSPRDETVLTDFAFSSSFGIPWEHVPELLVSRFAGESFTASYWGPNGIKFHSEYLGLPVVALAIVGALNRERRGLVACLVGIGALFMLVSLGGATPFYRLWWNVVPFVKSTRAPGMALFCVSFAVASLAALGLDRCFKSPTGLPKVAMIAGGVMALLGLTGVFGTLATNLAAPIEAARGIPTTQIAMGAAGNIRVGALFSGLALGGIGAILWASGQGKLAQFQAGMLIAIVIGTDLFLNAKPFWNYTDVANELFAPDEVKEYLNAQPKPLRVMNPDRSLYPGAALMADNIAQWYGHHGNELQAFDVVNGRQGRSLNFSQAQNGALAAMYGINHIVVPSAAVSGPVPGFEAVLEGVPSSTGIPTTVLRRTELEPYGRIVRAAAKATVEQAAATVVDPRFPMSFVVILDETAEFDPGPAPDSLPDPWPDVTVSIEDWVPGSMRAVMSRPVPEDAYLVIAENYYPDWRVLIDGEPGTPVRGNGSLITVPVPAGTREVALTFESDEFDRGVMFTWLSLLITLGMIIGPPVWRRKAGSGA